MAVVEVKHLVKRFQDTAVVNDLCVSVESGEILALLGASGCGKTTTLRCIAGLETPTAGEIWIGERLVASPTVSLPAEQRGVGMVFQSYALWPHMTVSANVAYGLKLKHRPEAEVRTAVQEALKLVALEGLESRYPGELSGGQQQRVALARSMVTRPAVLLLDEPLSNLDAKLRERMRGELRELIKSIGITAIHITHDQIEAMTVADRVAVMEHGSLVQIGAPRDIFHRPATRFVADFVGAAFFLEGQVEQVDADRMEVRTRGGLPVWCTALAAAARGAAVVLAIRPEYVQVSEGAPDGGPNDWSGTVKRAQFIGPEVDYTLDVQGEVLRASSLHDVPVGRNARVSLKPEHVVALLATDVSHA